MKIVLAALNAKYVHSNLAVYDLEAYTKEKIGKKYVMKGAPESSLEQQELLDLVVREYTINHNLDTILQALYQEKASVVAFSCYIWNIHEILTIAKELHKVSPETQIWLGGPEVSYNSVQLVEQHPFVNGIIKGEGEETFYELVEVWFGKGGTAVSENRKDYHNIRGIVYRDANGQIVDNPMRPLIDLDCVPFVYKDLSRFQNRILYYESSRGCPFSCSYCLSSIDKSVRFRSMELVERELQFFLDHNVSQVKFIDRTFNCKREHSLSIWRYIMEHDNGITNFHFEVSADLLEEEELQLFRKMRPGLIQLEIGLQSTNPKTIKEIRRRMDIDKLKRNMLSIRQFGNIHQHLDLIAGLPYEDLVTFKQSFNDAYAMKPNQLQLGFLKVLKGSYMGEQVRAYQLQYQDTQPYEVLSTKWITYDEILELKLVEEMVEVYYNSDQFEHVLSYIVPFFESPYVFYETLGTYYKVHDLFGIGYKRETRYQVLKDFCVEWFGKSDEYNATQTNMSNMDFEIDADRNKATFSMDIFISLLTHDYYLRENAKSRPSWAKDEPIDKSEYHTFFKNGGTEEVSLVKEGYDSKVAARMMHIEPIVKEAVHWIANKKEDVDSFAPNCKKVYCLFDYENRNPLSKDASVVLLTHL